MKHQSTLLLLALVALTFGVFFNSLHNGFVNYDDPALLYDNPLVPSFDLKNIFSSTVAEDYIPLVITTYAIEHALVGYDPFYFHLTNLLLHIANVCLVFLLLSLITKKKYFVPFIAAVIFAIHPLHVESVAWVAERKDVLSTFLFLLAFIAYYFFLEKERRWILYVLSFSCFVLALFAKFMAVTLPAILLLLHFSRKDSLKKSALQQLPFIAVGLIFTYIHLLLHNRGQHLPEEQATFVAAIIRALDSLAFYINKTFWPFSLSAFYEQGVVVAEWMDYAVASTFVGVVIWRVRRNRELLWRTTFGGLFFLITILPVLQIVTFGNKFAFADRFMYLPSIGLFFLIAVLWEDAFENGKSWKRASARVLLFAICVGLSALTYERNKVWASSQTLWQDEVLKYPRSSIARNNLGSILIDQGQYDQALIHLNFAISLKPDYVDPYINIGLAKMDLNKLEEARAFLEKALSIESKNPQTHLNLGVVLEKQGNFQGAFEHYQAAVGYDPQLSIARHNLGVMYYRGKNLDKALEVFKETLIINPSLAETHHNMGVVYSDRGQYELAIQSFRQATALDPLYLEPHLQLLSIYQKLQQPENASAELEMIRTIQQRTKSLTYGRPRPRRSQ